MTEHGELKFGKADDERHAQAEDHIHNIRVQVALAGYAAAGPCNIAQLLISLLESDEPIEPATRVMMVEALGRGLSDAEELDLNDEGLPMPRIVVGGLGREGRLGKAIRERRKWLDAAEEVKLRRERGKRGNAVIEEVGAEYGLGFEVMKKAIKLHNRFLAEIGTPESELITEVLNRWGVNTFNEKDEDQFYFARSLFIDREAESKVK